jgi:hypothetical protein
MGRQWNAIIDALSGGTMAINVNVADIEALLTTLQADVADGIKIDGASATTISTFTSATSADVLTASTARKGAIFYTSGSGSSFLSLGTSTTSTSAYSLIVSQSDIATITGYTGKVTGFTTDSAVLHITSFS